MIINNIEEFLALKPRYYKFLKALNLTRTVSNEECSKYNLELILSKVTDEDIRIRCTNVFNINIGCIEGMFGLLISIEDISNMQIEGGKFRVIEQEERAFSFYCEEFFVEHGSSN